MNRRSAIGIGAAAAVLAAGGGVAVLVWPGGPAPAVAERITSIPPDPHAKAPAVRAVVDPLDLAAAVTAAGGIDLRPRGTRPFSMLSVSWTDPAAAPSGAIEVRTRSDRTGKWTAWQRLGVAEAAADRPAEVARTHGATDPFWAGRSDGVAARIAGGGGALPAGLELNLIDTDVKTAAGRKNDSGGQGGGGEESDPPATPADETAPADDPSEPTNPPVTTVPTEPTTEPVPTTTVETPATTAPDTQAPPTTTSATTSPAATPSGAVPVPSSSDPVKAQLPPYVSRAGWQADETLVMQPIFVAPAVKVIWVHHTGFGNEYTCADSASVIRGIQANDVKVKGLDDMGYNFLVDQCGTLFEGRKGGVTNAVIGAHTVGFNTGSVGLALLGDYTSAHPTVAAETTIAQVAAARLGAYGFSPTSTGQMTEGVDGRKWPINSLVTFPRVSGHKDAEQTSAGYLTECPGTYLYDDLPSIRARSVEMITGLAAKSLAGGLSVSGTFYVRGSVTINWAVDTPSASIARFELLRDGKVAATVGGTARSGSITLAAGSHTVQVRAVHVSGATGVTPSYRVIADATAPAITTAPAPALRTGTYSTTSAPVTVSYRTSDNVKLYTVTATRPATVHLATTATSWYATMKPGANTTFSLTSRDVPGNTRTVSVVRKANLLAESKASRSGSWTTKSYGSYLSGKALSATRKNAKLTYTFTGRSAALLFSRGSKTGKAYIYVDGKKVATIDTKSSKALYRQAVFVKTLTAKKHTIAVVVAGTSGRPTVVSDGLAYIS
ncbi:N-acetylmuramoyl-L-alanine amidase [Actinoplanes sp. NPDC051411]|uniref:N-acetylmuramoyl-L-alanine amidase n=1 Tax=Actinoplanes sp. NPDC051411 TaxID=3155522 RepID=UPI00342B1CB2